MNQESKYLLVCPCRDEADYMRQTLDSLAAQTVAPALCLVVDDGSTDATPEILAEYEQRLDWLKVLHRHDRGIREVGAGPIDAFNEGLDSLNLQDYDFVCKLDLDLKLPEAYFETIMQRMRADPRMGSYSGKPYVYEDHGIEPEPCGNELSVGQTKFYRVACFIQIGGFESILNWEAIDNHRARKLGWKVWAADDVPELRFMHLRRMGSSHHNVLHGRYRHGAGQYIMGTGFTYILASTVYRMATWPLITGGLAIAWGYFHALITAEERYGNQAFRKFLRRYQWQCLLLGKHRATARVEAQQADAWQPEALEFRPL